MSRRIATCLALLLALTGCGGTTESEDGEQCYDGEWSDLEEFEPESEKLEPVGGVGANGYGGETDDSGTLEFEVSTDQPVEYHFWWEWGPQNIDTMSWSASPGPCDTSDPTASGELLEGEDPPAVEIGSDQTCAPERVCLRFTATPQKEYLAFDMHRKVPVAE